MVLLVYRAGGSGGGGGGGGEARAPPPTFCHRKKKKKKGEGGERTGKRVFIQSPTEMYTCIKNIISPSNGTKMYKTPELRRLRPLDPIRYELGCASAPSQLIFPLSNLVPPTGVLVGGGGGSPAPQNKFKPWVIFNSIISIQVIY